MGESKSTGLDTVSWAAECGEDGGIRQSVRPPFDGRALSSGAAHANLAIYAMDTCGRRARMFAGRKRPDKG